MKREKELEIERKEVAYLKKIGRYNRKDWIDYKMHTRKLRRIITDWNNNNPYDVLDYPTPLYMLNKKQS